MHVARGGAGGSAAIRALASQIHPVFMLPPIAASWFGGVLVGEFSLVVGALHATAIFAAVYTAHVKDGYVDFYTRGEDDSHPMTEFGCKLALAGATTLFFASLFALWLVVDWVAVALTLPCWLIAYHHAPQLDTNPVTVTAGYPTGIALAILGGYYVQATTLSPIVVAFALVFLVLLCGVKIVDDEGDYEYDRSIEKRTVAVVLGRRRARTLAYGLVLLGLALVVGFASVQVFPPSSILAVLAFGTVAAIARRAEPTLATMLLIRGSYVFLALLVMAVWFRPFM